jgi:lysyl-tRNA synthetase class 2
MLKQARTFFYQRELVEVDCPILSPRASIDAHIDLIPALYHGQEVCYLHSSPEYGMKRLLADGVGDCFQLSHVFRDGELSGKHNPEFMMAEWYRLNFSLEEMIGETADFIRLFLGPLPVRILSYRALFLQETGIDYVHATEKELLVYLQDRQIPFYPSILNEGKDALLNLILGYQIEPTLGQNELFILAFYPASQAALAQKRRQGEEEVAERFEVYHRGIELANGYRELTDAQEQRRRLHESNAHRKMLGKNELPIDENFLNALEQGLPPCAGVAVGFDRLMMLRHPETKIEDVIAWGWEKA